ncbi:glycoside hydrolase family 97 catalytic domain-containing protein [Lentzea flaviverrucosa]|uniref:NPCBM-associated, NEW3 domain of alpha-galactosidase n=1 Tax=Lentzea flaviverrucosa TaxID=200379 RepID=A0A1H9XDA5_9PSEU|nr:glycoside hydrolase family 97 catalytic domain-containing protein [Lentzea flaviverrucosa]RDI21569.1 alpha-galactosidase-like protein [Lentzea flaviverrucosa]SES44104.1 NPCBM-associated, NEW3 domain of alpha-galactosidase [Lentzea flaviverrucosa]
MSRLLVLVLALLLPAVPATAAPTGWTVAGPGQVTARLSLNSGNLTLDVSRQGRTVLKPARVGLTTTTADLTEGLTFTGRSDRVVIDHYTMPHGKRLHRSARMTEARFGFRNAAGSFDLVVRAAADGVAYRYVLPAPATVTAEASAFSVAADSKAWLLPYNAWYEANRVRTTAGEATGDFGYPSLFQTGQDFALLTESDVDGGYAGSRLRKSGDGFQVVLADAQVASTGTTPWRTAIVGDLGTVSTSTLVDDLASPAKFADVSWVRPGKVAWSWLSEHSSPSDFARQKQYVDFAARNGWEYALVDEGWSAAWVPELIRHARAQGVEILLWLHWSDLDTAQERDTVLPRIKQWGAKGVKLDFMESDSQERYRWYDAVLQKTADLKLMVNFHGSTIPHGLARTWPHVLTMEAVRGAENYPPAANNPVQFFTRNVAGSMDYTPVSLEVGTKEASIAHEVALPVVYESGWTHFADKPEAYERHPQALRYLDQVPTVWDESRLLDGDPDSHAVVARRNGDRWFVGGIATQERTLRAPLSFAGGGQWLVETVRDPATRADVVRDTQVLRNTDTLSVAAKRNGGFAAVVCRYRPGLRTCDQPIRQVPKTTLTVGPTGTTDTPAGTAIEVSGTFTNGDKEIRDVRLTATAPEGWSVTGAAVQRRTLAPGESVSGRWRLTAGTRVGPVDLPVVATFGSGVHVEQAVKAFVPPPVPGNGAQVSDLPFMSETNGWGPVERDRSNGENTGGDGAPLTIGGVTYAKGLGTHAPSEVSVYLGRGCERIAAKIGLDDETEQPGSVVFQVFGDDKPLYDSGVISGKGAAVPIDVDVSGVRMLSLRVTDGGDGRNFDHADWAEAALTC